MTDPQLGLTMLVLFIGAIALGFPIAFTLMALGLGFGYMGMGDAIFSLFVQRTYAVMSNDVLISIPLFVFRVIWSNARISWTACSSRFR